MDNRRYKSEVIEVYPSEGKAAVKFSWRNRERVECVRMYIGVNATPLEVGMRGWMRFTYLNNIGVWGFEPFKGLGGDAVRGC